MRRAVTAIYRTYDVADLVRDELVRLGIGRDHVVILPDANVVPDATHPSRSTTTHRGDPQEAIERLHDLHLPEADTRIYQQAIRSGDYVVSASVGNDVDLARIEQIMRRPEDAYDLDDLDTRYAGAEYAPRRRPLAEGHDDRVVGRRDESQLSPYMRSYRRGMPYVPPIALAPY